MEKENDLVRVYSGTEITVILMKGELEQAGIQSMMQNDFETGLSAGFVGGVPSAVELYIQKADLDKAEPILKDFIKNNG